MSDDSGSGSSSVDSTSIGLMKQMHNLEVRILQGLAEQQQAWRVELTGIDRRMQVELHKLMLDVNARFDRLAKENAEHRERVLQDTVGKRSEDYRAMLLAVISMMLSAGMAVLQFVGAKLFH